MLGVVPFIFSILRDRPDSLDALLIAAMIGKNLGLAASLRRFREVCGEEQVAEK